MNRISFGAFVLALASAPIVAQGAPAGFGTVHDEEQPSLSAAETADGVSAEISGKTLSAEGRDESVVLAAGGARLTVSNSTLKKSGDTTNDGQSNFYGLNASAVSSGGSALTLSGVTIESAADGANAVFATGEGSTISAKNVRITTTANSSRGLDATYGGTVNAENVYIDTKGAHSAAFATDRGEGTIIVNGGTAATAGEGSPVIYSTGAISVKGITGRATGAEIACIEGKNSIAIDSSSLEGAGPNGIMLYQSFSGDAGIGTSSLVVKNSTLKSTSKGAFFYITNTNAKIAIANTNLSFPSGVLIRASGNNSERGWGRRGANGGNLDFTAANIALTGDIECDAISSVNLDFGDGAAFTGAINSANAGAVTLTLAKSATVRLTGDSYVEAISDTDKKFRNIISNGHNIYYNKNAAANKSLKGKTYKLSGGGKLIGIAVERKAVAVQSEERSMQPMGEPPAALVMTGVIKVYGNAPHTTLGFVSSEGKEYAIATMSAPPAPGGNPPPNAPKGAPNGQPKAPMGAPNGEKPPVSVSREQLEELAGESVEITGFLAGTDMPSPAGKSELVVLRVQKK